MTVICPSEVSAVDVFARGALVTRRVTLPQALPPGVVVIVLEGVTPLAEAGSFRAAVEADGAAGWTVRAVRSGVVVPAAGEVAGEDAVALEKLGADLRRVTSELDALSSLGERVASITLEPRLRRRAPPAGPASILTRAAEALAADAMLDDLSAELDARRAVLMAEHHALTRARDDLALRHAQSEAAARRGVGHPTRRVEVELTGEGPITGLTVRYAVPAARWWPRYVLRIEDNHRVARWSVEALVAHRSGEDWGSVQLSLSTADLLFDARLPELASLRLGRAQPPRRGFRALPSGLDAMFAGYDKAFGAPVPALPAEAWEGQGLADTRTVDFLAAQDEAPAELLLERAEEAKAHDAPADGGRSMPMQGMPMAERRRSVPLAKRSMEMPPPQAKSGGGALGAVLGAPFALAGAAIDALSAPGRGGGYGGPEEDAEADTEAPVEPADAWLDYDVLTLAGPDAAGGRGRLARRNEPAVVDLVQEAKQAVEALEGPSGGRDPRDSRGDFDHRYEVAGRAEVPGDGRTHRVSLGTEEAQPLLRWRTVPRVEAEVFREAELRNPFEGPLLAGPVEVFVDGSLLTVTEVDRIDRGGILRVGLGVERRIRVARNVRMTEETAGLLGGETVLTHRVSIELSSALATPALVDVVDRVPVSDEKGVTVTALPGRPEPEGYTQADRGQPSRGLRSWKVIVAPGASTTVEHGYRVTLPSKNELVGGNRRG